MKLWLLDNNVTPILRAFFHKEIVLWGQTIYFENLCSKWIKSNKKTHKMRYLFLYKKKSNVQFQNVSALPWHFNYQGFATSNF